MRFTAFAMFECDFCQGEGRLGTTLVKTADLPKVFRRDDFPKGMIIDEALRII